MTKIDVVIPTYNSSSSIDVLIERLENWSNDSLLTPRFIFVDDASPDNTLEVLQNRLASSNLKYKIIGLARNNGQHTAVATGFRYAEAPYVTTIDDDLQHNPYDIDKLFKSLIQNNHDLVFAKYHVKKHHSIRNLGTKVLQTILKWADRDYSMVTSFRLMKKEIIQPFKQRDHKVYFIEEYLLDAATNIGVVDVIHHERLKGDSNYSAYKLVRMAFLILILHSSFPLKMINRIGLLMAILFFGIGIYYIIQKVFFYAPLGFTSIIVSIFFSTGMILFSIGIIGEYIRKMWIQNQGMNKVILKDLADEQEF